MISIITPVYNVEPYIRQCLDSVLSQEYNDWEWILVDDGSTDNCLSIIREYEKDDTRIHVFTQENQGPAAARNLALKHIKGDYITFLDSDDWIEKNAFSLIRDAIEKYQPDMVMWNFKRYTANGYVIGNYPMPEPGYYEKAFTQEYAADFIFEYKKRKGQYFPSCWIRAIRAEIIKENGLRFNPNLKRTEDYMFLAEVHAYLEDMVVIGEALSVYRVNEESITHSYTKGYMRMIDEIYDSVIKLPLNLSEEELVRRADLMYIYRAFVAIKQEIGIDTHVLKKVSNIREIMNNKKLIQSLSRQYSLSKRIFGKRREANL